MDLAFLLLVAKPGRRLSREQLLLTTLAAPAGLHFRPDRHDHWEDQRLRVSIGCWRRRSDARTAGAWSADEHGVAVTTGPVRIAGRAWEPTGQWAATCRASIGDAESGMRRLRGIFTLVRLDESIDGFVVSDPLGLSFSYHGENADVAVIGSRAELVARAVASPRSPSLDPLGVCGLAYSSYRIGHRTGFAGVRTVPPGTSVVVNAESGAELASAPLPWIAAPALSADPQAALDLILDEITEIVSTSLSAPASHHIADLTGGKDSRLVLAAAIHAGVADQLTFRTDGPPDLPDVLVASDLAGRLNLSYEADLRLPQQRAAYGDRLRSFVMASGGITNAWDLKTPGARRPEVRLSGLNGECLRAHSIVEQPPRSDDDLIRWFDRSLSFGQLGLVKPEPVRAYRSEALALLLERSGVEDPLDRLESFQIQTRARARYGPLDELDLDLRILGLYSIDAIRAAFSLGSAERQIERVHYELMRRVSPILVDHPFAGPGWPRTLTSPAPSTPSAPSCGNPGDPQPKATPLMAQLRLSALEERRSAHDAVLADPANPAWDVLDRERTQTALARADSLSRTARMELFGAITAAIWLAPE